MYVIRIAVAALLAAICANAAPAGITLTSSTDPSASAKGQSITPATATVAPPTASSKVTFYDSATILGIAPVINGQASLTTSLLPAGQRSLTANYAGVSSAILTQLVGAPLRCRKMGFKPPVTYPGVHGAVVVADFNGDGIADLALPGSGSAVSVLLGHGVGNISPAVSCAVGGSAVSVAVGDFNGDGKPDLVVGTNDASVSILLGNGDGNVPRAAMNFWAPSRDSRDSWPCLISTATATLT